MGNHLKASSLQSPWLFKTAAMVCDMKTTDRLLTKPSSTIAGYV